MHYTLRGTTLGGFLGEPNAGSSAVPTHSTEPRRQFPCLGMFLFTSMRLGFTWKPNCVCVRERERARALVVLLGGHTV